MAVVVVINVISMKKIILIIGSLAFFQYFAQAQLKRKKNSDKLKKTEIELVYNHYVQDGDNSAVTGGVGTESLRVYGPSLTVKKYSGQDKMTTKIGADVISSASTDNIDFVMSSASRLDARAYANVEYARTSEEQNIEVFTGVGMSIESDYLSISSKLGISKQGKNKLNTFSAQLQFFNDDLRWGRVNKHVKKLRLVYPAELRYQDWYEEYRRRSYNLKLGYSRIINKRNVVGLYPEIIYQKGLLATPFHRVYFADGQLGVEQLPNERFKGAVAARWNSFITGNVILKNSLGFYTDNFGVTAFSIGNETAFKISPIISLMPNVRFYSQQGSHYFKGYKEHNSRDEFFTSDYDYATIETYRAGLGFRYNPGDYLSKRFKFNSLLFRYSFYYRTNGLTAHIFTLAFRTTLDRNKDQRKLKLQFKRPNG